MAIAGYNLLRQVGEQHTLTENQGVDSSNLSLGTTKTRSKGGFLAVWARQTRSILPSRPV